MSGQASHRGTAGAIAIGWRGVVVNGLGNHREGNPDVPLKLKKTVKQMLAEANAEIETVSAQDALKLKDDPNVVFVDIRDVRELDRDGRIPGALHAPRGMLEFWVDPESPYYREVFGTGKKFLFF
jgi:hypothetical protein